MLRPPVAGPPVGGQGVLPPATTFGVTGLVPEEIWLQSNPQPFSIVVNVANEEPNEKNKAWKLDGRTVSLSLDPSYSIEQVKQELEKEVLLPVNLMKLQHASKGFLKNKETCAYYNLKEGESLELTRQQRGGKKK